jgi:predicted membrane protein
MTAALIAFCGSCIAYFVFTIAASASKSKHRLGANTLAQVATLFAFAASVVQAFTTTWFWWITAAIWAGLFVFTATASRRSLRELIKAEADLAATIARIDAVRGGGAR